MTITLIIIIATCIVSFTAFSNDRIINDLIFEPPAITYRNQWYRFFTCGFIHADYLHLGFNMYSFYMFGDAIEDAFVQIFGHNGKAFFLILYITALFFCLVPTYLANKDNYHYRSLGASGAVSAIVFAFIILAPTTKLSLIILPIPFPAFIFGIIYLIVSAYLSKKGGSNINHSAHFWGAVYGIVFLIVMCNLFSHFKPVAHFIDAIQSYFGR
ncbi:MAG: rhomboid family intramembrane serine protease [Chitinophaga sp.]|jgi:membrane associated rhomboid family serine protease|nr:rhomboid family intramembrane serine protease [Chitinophaga sp.]